MRSKCIPFILLLIIAIGLASCGKAAGTTGSGIPDTEKASDQTLTETPDRSAGDIDPNDPEPSAETDGTSATDDTADGPESTESTSLSSTAEDSSFSTSGQNPARSSSADSAVPSSEAGENSSKPADPHSNPDADAEEDTGMDHKVVRTRPEHTVDDLNPPAPQAPAYWTAPASQTTNPSDSNSKKQEKKKEKKQKSKKGNRIGSSMGGGGF